VKKPNSNHQHKEPTKVFINEFGEKHKVCLPNDIFFVTGSSVKGLPVIFI